MKKAVITSGGHQYIVAEKEQLEVELVGDSKTLSFEPLMIIDGDKVSVGQPIVKGVKVSAKVVEQEVKGDKVTSIRYKSKKRVHKTKGHRQKYSLIEITSIK